MNPNLLLDIADLALSLVESKNAAAADTLLKIIQKSVQAYEDHTGEPLDPSLIKAEEPL